MQIKEAIVERIKNICLERGMKYNELATRSGVTGLQYARPEPPRPVGHNAQKALRRTRHDDL